MTKAAPLDGKMAALKVTRCPLLEMPAGRMSLFLRMSYIANTSKRSETASTTSRKKSCTSLTLIIRRFWSDTTRLHPRKTWTPDH